jgi:hypothetical protein
MGQTRGSQIPPLRRDRHTRFHADADADAEAPEMAPLSAHGTRTRRTRITPIPRELDACAESQRGLAIYSPRSETPSRLRPQDPGGEVKEILCAFFHFAFAQVCVRPDGSLYAACQHRDSAIDFKSAETVFRVHPGLLEALSVRPRSINGLLKARQSKSARAR